MKNYKKLLSLIITFVLLTNIVSLQSFAVEQSSITDLSASYSNGKITVTGEVDGMLAVAVLIYKGDILLKLETFGVSDNGIKAVINIELASGEYIVKVADYEGGEYFTTNFSVAKPLPPSPKPEEPIDTDDDYGDYYDHVEDDKRIDKPSVIETTTETTTETIIKLPFNDVEEGEWYYKSINYVYSKGLFSGLNENTFAPNNPMTRGMLVTVLFRLEGMPNVVGNNLFKDVQLNEWYTDAIIWASNSELIGGYTNGNFGTNDNITREQMVTILYRYAKLKGYDIKKSNSLEKFNDSSEISSWAMDAMKWGIAEGLIEGGSGQKLSPKENASRAQVATILMRFMLL